MKWIIIALALFVFFFLIGFLLQIAFEKIEKNTKGRNYSASSLLFWYISMLWRKTSIQIASIYSKRAKAYIKEMQKPFNFPHFELTLQELLLEEKNIRQMQKTLEVVLHCQEQKRRKIEKNKRKDSHSGFFLVILLTVPHGPQVGKNLVEFYMDYLLLKKHRNNENTPLFDTKRAMKTYGTKEEQLLHSFLWKKKLERKRERQYFNRIKQQIKRNKRKEESA